MITYVIMKTEPSYIFQHVEELIRMENGIHPWYSSTHVIHPPMEFTHGIVNGIDPWYSSTHDIYLPMVL